jgi:hypothetical protein
MVQQTTHFQNIMIKRIVLKELLARYKTNRKERAIKRFVKWFNDTNRIRRDSGLYDNFWDTFQIPPFEFREFDGAFIVNEPLRPFRDDIGKSIIEFMAKRHPKKHSIKWIDFGPEYGMGYYCDDINGYCTDGPLRDLKGIDVIMDNKDNPYYAVTFIDTENDPRIINEFDSTHIECTRYGVTIFAIDIDWVLKQNTIPTKIEYLSVLEPISRREMVINGWED